MNIPEDLLTWSFLENIISELVIPTILSILTSVFTSIVGIIRLQYSNLQEKNRYINLLKLNSPSVEAVVNTINQFKRISQIYFVYILLLGLFLGGSFPLLFIYVCLKSYYITNFFQKYIALTDINNIDLLSYIVFLFTLLPALIILSLYLICCKLIKSRRPLTTNDNDFCKLRSSQILSYFSFWLSVGLITGPYALGIFIVYVMIAQKMLLIQNFSWTSNDKFALIFTIIIFLLITLLSLNILFDLRKKIKQFPKNVIDPIINYHKFNFQNLRIKIDSEEFNGQLKDFQNKYLVTLFEKDTLHFIYWDKIETLEVTDINKIQCPAHYEPKKKKSINVQFVTGILILFAFLAGFYIIYLANSSSNEINDLLSSGKYDEALQAYDKAIEINPNYVDTWNTKGNVLYCLARYDEALQAYDKAIEINPNNAIYYYNEGGALNKLGKYDEALQAYDKAIDIDPNYADVWNDKANALYGLARYDEALQAYNKSIELKE